MAQYKINILSSEEFDSLPTSVTKGSRIDDSLGFADPSTGEAYVRFTQVPELNQFLINHELEELTASESSHEDENGIRHKKFFKDILAPALTSAGIGFLFGGPVGAGIGAVSGAGKGLIFPASERRSKEAARQAGGTPGQPGFQAPTPTPFDPRAGGGPLGQFTGQGGQVGLAGGRGANVAGRLGSGLAQGGLNVARTGLDSIRKQQQFGDFSGRAGLRF